jgi:hypothetical protein
MRFDPSNSLLHRNKTNCVVARAWCDIPGELATSASGHKTDISGWRTNIRYWGKSGQEQRARMASIRYAPLAQQPGMDDLPLVASVWSKIQKRRAPVLKLAKKLYRVSGSWHRWINRMSSKPTIPFQKNQRFPFVLSH